MVITISCPSCQTSFPVDPDKIPEGGVRVRCSACAHVFRVEKPEHEVPAVPGSDAGSTPDATPGAAEPAGSEAAGSGAPDAAGGLAHTTHAVDAATTPSAGGEWFERGPFDQGSEAGGGTVGADERPEEANGSSTRRAMFEEGSAATEGEPVGPSVDAFSEPAADASLDPARDRFTEPAAEPTGDALAEPAAEPAAPAFPAAAAEAAAERPASTDTGAGAGHTAEEQPSVGPVHGFTFGKRDPTDKARRLARVLVSDMIMYNAERHQVALAQDTLAEDFEEEIDKSWKEYVDQVGPGMAEGEGRGFWVQALNDILAKGRDVF